MDAPAKKAVKAKKTVKRGLRHDPLPPVTARQKAAAKGGKATKASIGKTTATPVVSARQRRQAASMSVKKGY
jgi:hypothetical protein